MREAEEAAFARGIEVEALMDKAGRGVAQTVRQFFSRPGRCIVFAGKGHNGGDALVAATFLQHAGWKVDTRLAFPEEECAELTRKKLQAVREATPPENKFESIGSHLTVIDGLLGLGAKEHLREPLRSAAKEINRLRREENAFVFAVDLPTGFNGDSGETDPEDCVIADVTSRSVSPHGLILDSALDFVGRLEVVPLRDLVVAENAANEIIATPHSLQPLLPRRKFGSYKNEFGRIGVVAGSEGFIGAAMMATDGALRAGAGLVELFVPKELYNLMAATVPSEAMVKPVRSYRELAEEEIDIWAVGPGLGQERAAELIKFIGQVKQPMVVDADALNVLAGKVDILKHSPGPRLLTPHPGEMKRLFDSGKMSRAGTARNFCEQFPVTLLFKGSRTIVAERNRPLSYNSTVTREWRPVEWGDVLTGVCAGPTRLRPVAC
jgi:NAD(P)H-hydrate epimerase